jgi:hypothetical protein
MYSAELSSDEICAPARCEYLGEYSILKKQSANAEKVVANRSATRISVLFIISKF